METVEIVVYTIIAIVIGGMTIAFLTGWDYMKFYDNLINDEPAFEEVDNVTFVGKIIAFWEGCGLGAVDDKITYYVKGDAPFTEDGLFNIIIKLNMCNTLQSVSHNCGNRELVDFPAPIDLPHVIILECDPIAKKLIISG